ncbi:hypothetical protein AAXE64_27000 [Priestia megaterium]|uniref:hypothetical protein n=1 Tax=Priestia megaterium TaxID=1404 RepID=UPI003CFE2EA1
MNKRELMKEIDFAFERARKKDDWIYKQYKNFYELNQLSHFQIFKINWFNGAAQIMSLIDQLHTLVTSKEDFVALAKLSGIEVTSKMKKSELAELVKANPSWRSKTFELERLRRVDLRKRTLQPLYEHLSSLGYETDLLPVKVSYGKWMVDATNKSGVPETIYLNESPEGDSLLIQSTYNDFISIFTGNQELFVQRV